MACRSGQRAADLVAAALAVPVQLAADPAALSAPVGEMDRTLELLAQLRHAGIALASFAIGQPRLDDVFLTLTGQPANVTIPEEQAA